MNYKRPQKVEVIKKDVVEKRRIQQKRAALKLLRILIEEHPDDAKKFVKGLPAKTA